jgi:hypothetical protein
MAKSVSKTNFIKSLDDKMTAYVIRLGKETARAANKGKSKGTGKISVEIVKGIRSGYGFKLIEADAVTRFRIPGKGKTASGKPKYTMGEKAFDRSTMTGKLTKPWKSSIRQHKRRVPSGKIVNVRAHVKTYKLPFKPILLDGNDNWKVVNINEQIDAYEPIAKADWIQAAWESVYNKQGRFEKKLLPQDIV